MRQLARKLNLWVILGSTHCLGAEDKPTNCLYVISNTGRIRNRYDKMMCTEGDLKVYFPGNRLVTITIKGVKCGLLICADLGNPNLYHAYRRRGVKVLFHSYYNARFKGPIPNNNYVVPGNRAKSREYGMWIVANNSSARHSCWPTFVAGPDGYFRSLERHACGMLLHEFSVADLHREPLYHTGVPSKHPRAHNGQALP